MLVLNPLHVVHTYVCITKRLSISLGHVVKPCSSRSSYCKGIRTLQYRTRFAFNTFFDCFDLLFRQTTSIVFFKVVANQSLQNWSSDTALCLTFWYVDSRGIFIRTIGRYATFSSILVLYLIGKTNFFKHSVKRTVWNKPKKPVSFSAELTILKQL